MKKKILFAAYSLDVGGIETALVNLINYLAEKDYDITLVLERKQGIFLDNIDRGVTIIEYKPSHNKIRLIAKAINALKRVKFICKYKGKFDFSCAYATYSLASSFVARNASKNNALWVHNSYLDFFCSDEQQYKKFFQSVNCGQFKKIVFVSEQSRMDFMKRYPKLMDKTEVCNNLIDYERIIEKSTEEIETKELKRIFSEDKKDTIFLNVGRHDEKQKKLTRLISAAKKLKEEGYSFKVIFVGKGEQTEKYIKQVKDEHLEENIIFVGTQSNPYKYFKISDCIVMTSDFEGYPVVYVEAMILNRPIITTDVSDSRKDIQDKYGLVCDRDEESVYESMKRFIERGFSINEKFNPKIYNEKIINKVENLINGK